MAIAVSPMVPVPMWGHSPQYYLDEQQQQAYGHYQQATMHNHYTAMPTPLSGAPPVQHVRASSLPVASSQANNNGNGPWTPEMDDILVEMAGRLKWDQIAEQFFRGTKTGNACRKRFARLKVERAEPARWDPVRIQKVITAYNREGVRERMWRSLAEELGEKWQDVERCCYNQGFKHMTRKEAYGHSRRRSRATSHRSQASMNSDSGNNAAYDDEDPTDDSGIGGEVHSTQQLLQIPTHQYAARESYHEIPDYHAEVYYRDYRES